MEYALPEATIGAKWECVCNGIIVLTFIYIEYSIYPILMLKNVLFLANRKY